MAMTAAEREKFDELIHSHNLMMYHLRHQDAVFQELNNYRWFRFIMWIRPLAMPTWTYPRIVNTIHDAIVPDHMAEPDFTPTPFTMDEPPSFRKRA